MTCIVTDIYVIMDHQIQIQYTTGTTLVYACMGQNTNPIVVFGMFMNVYD